MNYLVKTEYTFNAVLKNMLKQAFKTPVSGVLRVYADEW